MEGLLRHREEIEGDLGMFREGRIVFTPTGGVAYEARCTVGRILKGLALPTSIKRGGA